MKNINIETLILFCQQNKIEIVPKFGSMELCKENMRELNLTKYQDFVNKITYTFDTPFDNTKQLNELKFNYEIDVKEMDKKALESLFPLVLISYVSLLKIYFLYKKNNPNKQNILKNIKLFLHWCNKHLDASMASEIQLAIKVFGGSSNFRKMIDLDKNADLNKVFKTLWGTAWDFFHMRMINFQTIDNTSAAEVYFITQDKNLFTLFKECQMSAAFVTSNIPRFSFVNFTVDSPYIDEDIFDSIDHIMKEFVFDRGRNQKSQEPMDIGFLYDLKSNIENDIANMNT